MSLYAIADTHLSLGSDKPMDIFRGWDGYVRRLEKNWRALVGDGDAVVIAGDVSWAMRLEDCRADFAFLDSLPGRKIILKGNHDYWWSTLTKINKFKQLHSFSSLEFVFNSCAAVGDYAVCGTRGWFFDSPERDMKLILRERDRLKRSVEAALTAEKEPIVFLHYPPVYEERVCEQIYGVLLEYSVKRCCFGHIHGDTTGRYRDFRRDGISFSLISCDSLGFCPKLIEKF